MPEDRCQPVENLDTVAERSDVITVHLPLTPQTRGLIGKAFFDKVKAAGRSIALVNTARGGVVDEEALLEALQSGIVRAAAIDVWSLEGPGSTLDPESTAAPDERDRLRTIGLLRHHPAVLPTSHIGALTTGVLHRCGLQCAQNIVSVVAGERGSPGFIATPAQ
jgi:D-3-phosphoglycerate dehydrogenase